VLQQELQDGADIPRPLPPLSIVLRWEHAVLLQSYVHQCNLKVCSAHHGTLGLQGNMSTQLMCPSHLIEAELPGSAMDTEQAPMVHECRLSNLQSMNWRFCELHQAHKQQAPPSAVIHALPSEAVGDTCGSLATACQRLHTACKMCQMIRPTVCQRHAVAT
jgi:hypothetical protein